MRKKEVARKCVVAAIILGLVFAVALGAAAEDGTAKKGFVLFGLSALFDGTESIRGGVSELIGGNQQLVEGLDTLGAALDRDVAGNLDLMKSGVDQRMIPGLDAILYGLTDDAVPGMRKLKEGIDDKVVPGINMLHSGMKDELSPGLGKLIAGITRKDTSNPGLLQGLTMLKQGIQFSIGDGLDKVIHAFERTEAEDGEPGLLEGLYKVRYGLSGVGDPANPGVYEVLLMLEDGITHVADPTDPDDTPGLRQGLTLIQGGASEISGGLGTLIGELITANGLIETQLKAGVEGQRDLLAGSVSPMLGTPGGTATNVSELVGIAMADISTMGTPANWWEDTLYQVNDIAPGAWHETDLLNKVVGTYIAINNLKAIRDPSLDMIAGVDGSGNFIMLPTKPHYPAIIGGIDYLIGEIGEVDSEGNPVITFDAEGNPDTALGALAYMKGGIDNSLLPGLVQILAGINGYTHPVTGDYVPGMLDALDGLQDGIMGEEKLVDGLDTIIGALTLPVIGKDDQGNDIPGILAALKMLNAGIGGDVPDNIDKLIGGVAKLDSKGDPKVTYDKKGDPDTIYAALVVMKSSIDKDVVPGLSELRSGLSNDVSGGLGQLISGFTSTEATTGYSGVLNQIAMFPKPPPSDSNTGVVEGLTLIRLGLSNPSFSPNPGGDPGVSDALGLVTGAIRTDVLDGIGKLKLGIVEKILPGLQEMGTGIEEQLQPGFSKVSMLLLVIWLVSLVVLLVVGILIGRARKRKASSGHGAAM